MSDYQPTEWQKLWPEHAEEIAQATDKLVRAINSLTITTGDAMVEATAAEWAVEQIRAFVAAEIEADLRFRKFDDEDE